MPILFVHSLEDMMAQTLGNVVATGVMYEVGRIVATKALRGAKLLGLGVEGLRLVADELTPLLGWGSISHSSFDGTRNVLRLQIAGSLFLRKRGTRMPSCHYSRGVAAGTMEALSGNRSEAIEVLCETKGDEYCEIVAGDSEAIFSIAEAFDGGL